MTSPGSLGWMSRGACQSADPEFFFPVATASRALGQISSAKAVCGRCGVQASCLSYALRTGQLGIWGGATEDERAALRTAWLADGPAHLARSGGQRGIAAGSVPSLPCRVPSGSAA